MRKNLTENIDGFEISVSQLPAMQALRTLTRIARLVSPALANADALVAGGLEDMDVNAIGKMAASLFSTLQEDEVEELSRVLLAGALLKQNGKSAKLLDVMDEVFVGKVFTLVKVLAFAFRANYGDFSDALRAHAQRTGPTTEGTGAESQQT